MAVGYSSDFEECERQSVRYDHRGAAAMIHPVLWLCLLAQPQAVEPAPSAEALTLLRAGIEAEKRHDEDAAIAAFRKASEIAPDSSLIFVRLGGAYMKKGDYADAIPPLKRAEEIAPDAPGVHQMLGFALLAQGYSKEAIPQLEKSREYGALGIAQLQSGQPAEAAANFQLALAQNPNDPDLLYYLSKASAALASQSLDKLLSLAPDSPRSHQALGQHYFSMKMYPQARKEYERALAMRPDLPGLRLELGQVFAATSQWEPAEEQFRTEAELQPGNAEAAYRLGDALLHQGKMKEAASELRRSDKLSPDMPETLYALGKSTAVSDPAAAAKAFLRITELERATPLAAQAYLALAEIHRKQGKTELAAREMQEYRRIQASAPAPVN
jgi:tetratricopeptide (TPR) repeat protein